MTLAQTDMNLCASNDARKTERELEAVYKKLMKKIRPKGQAKLRAVQNAWIEYRKKQCEFNTMGSIGGSVHPMVLSYCYEEFANQQKKILQEQLDCEEGDLSYGHQGFSHPLWLSPPPRCDVCGLDYTFAIAFALGVTRLVSTPSRCRAWLGCPLARP